MVGDPSARLPERFGRYRILKMLGEGGMGAVYLAHDSQLDRRVALKTPTIAADGDSQVLERFYREARAAATILHPNVCPIFDVGEIDDIPYLTMAYIEGMPLAALLASGKTFSPGQCVVLTRKLALALEEAHRRGVIHRDLKPANVMIDRRGEPILMDFGLARRQRQGDERLTLNGAILGTPAYMSPEQINGDLAAIGPASDVYGLGVILYELLAGRLPFEGSMMAMLAQALHGELPPPSQFNDSIDSGLEAICLKAMAKDRANRYESMNDFADALLRHSRGVTRATLPVAPRRTPSPAAPTPGFRASQIGGLRSAALSPFQPEAATPKIKAPREVRKRVTQEEMPTWVWMAGGIGIVLVIALVVFLSTSSRNPRRGAGEILVAQQAQKEQATEALLPETTSSVGARPLPSPDAAKLDLEKEAPAIPSVGSIDREGKALPAQVPPPGPAQAPEPPPREEYHGIAKLQRMEIPNKTPVWTAISPDGKLFGTGFRVGKTTIWKADGREAYQVDGWWPLYTADGGLLITAEVSRLLLHDALTGTLLRPIDLRYRIDGLSALPGCPRFLIWSRDNKENHYLHVAGLDIVANLEWPFHVQSFFTWSPDGQVLLFRPKAGTPYRAVSTSNGKPVPGYEAICKYKRINAILPGGLASVEEDGGGSCVVNVKNGTKVRIPAAVSIPGAPTAVEGSHGFTDQRYNLSAFSDGRVRLFGALGKELGAFSFPVDEKPIAGYTLRSSPDGRFACVASDKAIYLLRLDALAMEK